MKHDQIEKIMFVRVPDTSDVYSVARFPDKNPEVKPELVALGRGVSSDDYLNIITAAPYLYHQLSLSAMLASEMLVALEAIENAGGVVQNLKGACEAIINGALFSQQTAQVGYEKVADELAKQKQIG